MLDLLGLAKDIFREYGCGSLVVADDAFLLTLDIESFAKAHIALEDLRECSPRMNVCPCFDGDDLMGYEYAIIKSRDTMTLYNQEFSVVAAALMTAEDFSYRAESHQNFR